MHFGVLEVYYYHKKMFIPGGKRFLSAASTGRSRVRVKYSAALLSLEAVTWRTTDFIKHSNMHILMLFNSSLCVEFEILSLLYKTLHVLESHFISEISSVCKPLGALRSLLSRLLLHRGEKNGDAILRWWNTLPENLRVALNNDTLQWKLKTDCFYSLLENCHGFNVSLCFICFQSFFISFNIFNGFLV